MDELYVICRTVEIEDGEATGFVLMQAEESGEAAPWPILITRKGNNFYGFENACPHEGTRLDTQPRLTSWTRRAISSNAAGITPSSTSTPANASSAPARAHA